ncbi:AAA family ATPase [Candidatus Woesearchaeota archaeon]|nr:AAA family ATPase [Candidatus Woesearchaeota archaeon]
MGVFDDFLKQGESLFLDSVALDYDFIPKLVPYRETQQAFIANTMKPLFSNRNGKNILVHGPPGVGKTVATRHLLKELEEKTDEISPFYINCWQKNTTFKVLMEVCDQLGYKFTHNKKTDDLFKIVEEYINKQSAVFVFDEVDKLEDSDFLYMLLEKIYRKTIILITNYKEWIVNLDERIKSRLIPETLEFKAYNANEIKGILKQRLAYALVEGVLGDDAFDVISSKTVETGDIRRGLYMIKEAANIAEDKSSKKIVKEHAEQAIKKLQEFTIKKTEDLETEERVILSIVKKNPGKKIGDLFEVYQENGGAGVYKTFQRRIKKLATNKFLNVKKVTGGPDGSTTIVYPPQSTKLTDY